MFFGCGLEIGRVAPVKQKRDTVIQLSNKEAITDHACGAYSPHHNHLLATQLLNLCFDFWESRLLQLLIQRGKIGFE